MANMYPSESTTDESLVSSAAILGMMAGQVIFGALGDFLGRQLALCCTLLVCFAGAAGSALLTFESGIVGADIFKQLLYWRILLGIGAGGVYPLAATLARASSVRGGMMGWCCCWCCWCCCSRAEVGRDEDTGSTAVALMFSMQGVGYLAAHATGFVLLSCLPEASPVAWRLLLGLGAVLPLALAVALALALARARRYSPVQSVVDRLGVDHHEEGAGGVGVGGRRRQGSGSDEGEGGGERGASSPARFWLSVRDKRRLLSKLVGTAGSWFLFDVTFYGNQLYEDDVLEAVFGGVEDLKDEASQDSLVALVALPGYFVAVALVGRMGPRRVQVQGFLAMALLFAVIGVSFQGLRRHAGMLMLLYSLTFFFSNFGPNSTTFMLPSLTFPDQVRGSLNGISAAAGKLGALLGSLMFKPAAEAWGVGPVLVICALISLGGGVLTLALVDSGEEQPILVGAGGSGSGGNFEDESERTIGPQGIEMTEKKQKTSIRGRVAVDGHGGFGGANGSAVEVDGAQLSPGPSQGRSPIKSKKRGAGMGMYARVGGGVVNGGEGRQQYGIIFGDNSARGRDASEGGGGFREHEQEEHQTLRLGRTAEVEGQMEAGRGGSRWDADSDSSGDAHAATGSDLVQPA